MVNATFTISPEIHLCAHLVPLNPPALGLPIRPIFSKPLPPKKSLKRTLGLDSSLPAILLIGGGEGMGKLEDTVDQIAEKLGGSCQVRGRCRIPRRGRIRGSFAQRLWKPAKSLFFTVRALAQGI